MTLVQGPNGVVAAWDTDGQVYFTTIEPGKTDFSDPRGAPGIGRERKHPALAITAQGETILVWTEGTGWEKGGSLVWQVFDAGGKPTEKKGRVEGGIPVWGLPTVVATDRGITIIH